MARARKKPTNDEKDKVAASPDATKTRIKAKSSLRDRNKKAAAAKGKTKRSRKAADAAKKPASAVVTALSTEHHVLPKGSEKGFFTKSRSVAPNYVKDSLLELRNVSWPGRKETWKLVFAVFVFALAMGGFIAVLDYGLEKVMREVIL